MNKPRKRKNKILMINAVNEVTRERAQSFLTREHIGRIVSAYKNVEKDDGLSEFVSLAAIRSENYNLSIPLYVRANEASSESAEKKSSLNEHVLDWTKGCKAFRKSAANVLATFKE